MIHGEPSTLAVCPDCLYVLANGPESDEQDAAAERMAALWGETHISPGATDEGCSYCAEHRAADPSGGTDNPCDEGWFSMSRCDGCGSTYGGTRFHATAWIIPSDETGVQA